MPLEVQKINQGTVIDHVTAGAGSRVLQILSASYPLKGMAALIINAPSKKFGRKDIVKIEGVFIEEKIANRIALIAPEATMNIIKGGKVADQVVGYVPQENLVARAELVVGSYDFLNMHGLASWPGLLRLSRALHIIS